MRVEKFFQIFVFIFGIVFMFSVFRMSFRPNVLYWFISGSGLFLILGCFIVTLVFGFTRRENFIYRWMIIPLFCLFCIASLRFMNPLGLMLRDFEFKERINDYNSVVSDIRIGKIPYGPKELPYSEWDEIDMAYVKKLPSTVEEIKVIRCNDGGLVVLFRTTRTQGLVFEDRGNIGLCKKAKDFLKNFSLRPIVENWYRY